MAGMDYSIAPPGTGAAGLKDIYGMGAAVALGIVCATPARAIGTAVEVERVQTT
jgi:hypothetical protein